MFKKKEEKVISFETDKKEIQASATEENSKDNQTEFVENASKKKDKKKGKKKKIIFIVAGVAVLAIVIGIFAGKGKEMATPVFVTEVLMGDITQTVDSSGTVDSEETKVYFSPVSAPVYGVSLEVGEQVKAGDMLVNFETVGIENTIRQAELDAQITKTGADASITGINASLNKSAEAARNYDEAVKYVQHYTACVNQAKAQLSEANALAGEQESLMKELSELSAKQKEKPNSSALAEKIDKKNAQLKEVEKKLKNYNIQDIQNALEICSADLADYKMQKEQYEAQKETDPTASLQKKQQSLVKESADFSVELAKESLEKAKQGVKADFDAIVTEVAIVEGQTAVEGSELCALKNIKKVKVSLAISKYDIEKITEGQKAEVTINGHTYEGEVAKISKVASTNETGGTVVATDIHILNPDDAIVLGVEGKVKIETAKESDVLLIPSSCINYASDGVFCYVVVDNKVKRAEIEIGIADDEFTQVLSGLSEGDKVIKDLTTEMEEDQLVTIMDEKTLSAMPGQTPEEK